MIEDVQQFVTAWLNREPAIDGIVAKRITADELDKQQVFPAIRHTIISTLEDTDLDGVPVALHSRLQVDCLALDRHEANALCRLVRNRLRGYRGVFDGFEVYGLIPTDAQRNQYTAPKANAKGKGIRVAIQDFKISYQP
ncbi:tail completion protein gp17 [Rosistilla oblonga]|uniref:tail completion protein gp17 n=1 Tax=Rosistilla oblonga TaxID=2527990 RepID=UPI003A96B1F9